MEASVKVCKQLMEKAIEDREDPRLALLAWRNTPSELIFGCRTRTHLPMAQKLLSGTRDSEAHRALQKAKEKNKQRTITGTQARGAHWKLEMWCAR